MTIDKDIRFTAKKGLLYLLNNLSKEKFCPDIEEYFSKIKEVKMEEFKHKSIDCWSQIIRLERTQMVKKDR